jgi:hypothetical protein
MSLPIDNKEVFESESWTPESIGFAFNPLGGLVEIIAAEMRSQS